MPELESLPPLSRREREIMDVLFALGEESSAEDIRAGLIDPPSYSAVRAMLAKLEAKGVIRHREDGPRYLYAPTTERKKATRSAIQRLVRVFFSGSASQAAAALLKSEKLTTEELDELAEQIRRAKEKRS
jgi:predicted transcriptional regulator